MASPFIIAIAKIKRSVSTQKVADVTDLDGTLVREITTAISAGRRKLSIQYHNAANEVRTLEVEYVSPDDEHFPVWVPASQVGGTANSITLTPTIDIAAPNRGDQYVFEAEHNSTGSVTLNVSNTGARRLYFGASQAGAGHIRSGRIYTVVFDGNFWRVSGAELGRSAELDPGTSAGNVVVLGTGGKLPSSVLPDNLGGVLGGVAKPSPATAAKHYVIQVASSGSGGAVSLVEAVFRRYVTPNSRSYYSWVVPTGVTLIEVKAVGGGMGGDGGTSGNSGGASILRRGITNLVVALGGYHSRTPGTQLQRTIGGRVYGTGGDRNPNGMFKKSTVTVTPGETLLIRVGAGGKGGDEDYSQDENGDGDFGTDGDGGALQITNA